MNISRVNDLGIMWTWFTFSEVNQCVMCTLYIVKVCGWYQIEMIALLNCKMLYCTTQTQRVSFQWKITWHLPGPKFISFNAPMVFLWAISWKIWIDNSYKLQAVPHTYALQRTFQNSINFCRCSSPGITCVIWALNFALQGPQHFSSGKGHLSSGCPPEVSD